jgi:pimeloyl-ACP methyl ester carboxylesterase
MSMGPNKLSTIRQCRGNPAMSPQSLRVRLLNGLTLNLNAWGTGNRICLLIHGFGEGSYVWNQFGSSLGLDYCAFAIDLRGHGDSDWDTNSDYDITTHASDVVNVIRALGWNRIVMVGHSMGGNIAVRVATRCCERISGLVLVDYSPTVNSAGAEQVREAFRAGDRIYRSISDYVHWLGERRPLVRPDILQEMAHNALLARKDGTYRRKADPSMLRPEDYRPHSGSDESELWTLIGNIASPVLLVRGEGSAVLDRSAAEKMTNLLPNGHLISVKLSGHDVMNDNPAGFLEATLPFILNIFQRDL